MKEYLQLFSRLCVSPLVSCTFLLDSFSLLFFPCYVLDCILRPLGWCQVLLSLFFIFFLYSPSPLLFLLKTITYPKLCFFIKVCVYLSDSCTDLKVLTEYITICLKKHLPSIPPLVNLCLSYHLYVYIIRQKTKKKVRFYWKPDFSNTLY